MHASHHKSSPATLISVEVGYQRDHRLRRLELSAHEPRSRLGRRSCSVVHPGCTYPVSCHVPPCSCSDCDPRDAPRPVWRADSLPQSTLQLTAPQRQPVLLHPPEPKTQTRSTRPAGMSRPGWSMFARQPWARRRVSHSPAVYSVPWVLSAVPCSSSEASPRLHQNTRSRWRTAAQ